MSTMTNIREALAQALTDAIPGTQFSPYLLANPTPPCGQVTRGPIEYDQTFGGGLHALHFIVTVYVALLSDIGAQQLLDRYLDPTGAYSIHGALDASDHTLGGLIQDFDTVSATGEQPYTREQGGPVLGSDWTVNVWL